MSNEMEVAGAASLGGLSSGGKADLTGQPCRNCGEIVGEKFCTRCGQLAASFHRPFLSLAIDSISDSFAFDSRIARTMPLLMFRPGRLTQRYNDGKRARYVPPFRLFLLTSVLFYFAVFALLDRQDWANEPFPVNIEQGQTLTAEELADVQKNLRDAGIVVDDTMIENLARRRSEAAQLETAPDAAEAEPEAAQAEPEAAAGEAKSESNDMTDAFEQRMLKIADNPRLLMIGLQTWAPRLSLLLVPLTMLALSFMYFWVRRLYIYNHAVHALHLHAWMYLVGTLTILLSMVIGGTAAAIFFIILPFYVTLSLRGAYGTGYFLSFVRAFLLLTFWTISMSSLTIFAVVASVLSV